MPKGESRYKIANYRGTAPLRPEPADRGTLLLTPRQTFEFYFEGASQFHYGPLALYRFDVAPTVAEWCRVTLVTNDTGAEHAAFDVSTPAGTLIADIARRNAIVAAARKANALTAERDSLVAEGSWWLAPDAFKGLGLGGRFSAADSHYLGGWSGHTKTYTGKLTQIIVVDEKGVSLSGFKTIFTIPWSEITALEVDGADDVAKRVSASRVLLLGPLALAAKKTTKTSVLIVTTRSGDQALFPSEKYTAVEMRAKLLPIINQVRKANVEPPAPALPGATAAGSPSVADELTKLAQLKEAGVLTEEEFASQKARLLA